MKTENTLENKSKFFAQYFGQKVLLHESDMDDIQLFLNNEMGGDIKNWLLYLKPFSQISNEDTIQGIMFTYNKTYEDLGESVEGKHYNTFSSIKTTRVGENFKTSRSIHHWNGDRKIGSKEYDYFRSKGYALPWMDLSVEDLVEYGWVKLKED